MTRTITHNVLLDPAWHPIEDHPGLFYDGEEFIVALLRPDRAEPGARKYVFHQISVDVEILEEGGGVVFLDEGGDFWDWAWEDVVWWTPLTYHPDRDGLPIQSGGGF